MSHELSTHVGNQLDDTTMLKLVSNGDCSALNPDQKLMYYKARCEAAGLDPRAQPFQYIKMQGKEVLYALKACTDQLASKHGIVTEVVSQTTEAGIRTVVVRARAKDGRQTDEIGCVNVAGLQGDALCNAYMKAVTKAKRRAVLSLAGLGMLDETELETIPGNHAPAIQPPKPKAETPKAEPVKAEIVGKAPEKAQEPQPTPIKEAIQKVVENAQPPRNGGDLPCDTIQVEEVEAYRGVYKTGKRKGEKYTKYVIVAANGKKYGTFDEAHASVAADARVKGLPLLVRYETDVVGDKTYYNAVTVGVEMPAEDVNAALDAASEVENA